MVGVSMGQEIRLDPRYGAVAEGIDGDGHAVHDFVEWSLAFAREPGPAETSFLVILFRLLPSFVFGVALHQGRESVGILNSKRGSGSGVVEKGFGQR